MGWGADAFAEAPWSAGVVPNTAPPGQVLPPPVPGGTNQFLWTLQQGAYPWSFFSWAGGTQPVSDPGGGVIAAPDPDTGVINVTAWWPYAGQLLLVRTTPDGALTPVRGGYPLSPQGTTRRNVCLNPSAKAGLNGYVPGAGNPTLSQIVRTDVSGSAWRATIATAGTDEVAVPVALPAGAVVTIGIDLCLSSRPAGVTITAGWNNSSGGALAATVITFTNDQFNASISQFGRLVGTVAPPAGAAVCSTLKVTATGLPANSTMDGSRVTVEQGYTDGSPYDGDSLGGVWLGTADLSASLLAPVVTVSDGECPLDVPVTYQVADAALVGGSATSPPVTLASVGDTAWLTHPASPSTPVACQVTQTPTPVYAMQQVVLPIIGSPYPVVMSATNRQRPKGTYNFWCDTFADKAALLALMADGTPLLLRAPSAFGYGYSQWLAFADATEDAGGRPAYMQGRTIVVPYQEVAPPATPGFIGG